MTDEDADNNLRKHLLGCVQLLTFAVALSLLAIVYYSDQSTGEMCGKDKAQAESRSGDIASTPEDTASAN
jgi:hypothetical protein